MEKLFHLIVLFNQLSAADSIWLHLAAKKDEHRFRNTPIRTPREQTKAKNAETSLRE